MMKTLLPTTIAAILLSPSVDAAGLTMRLVEQTGAPVEIRYSGPGDLFNGVVSAGRSTWRSIGANDRFEDGHTFDTFALEFSTPQAGLEKDTPFDFANVDSTTAASLGGMSAGQAAALSDLIAQRWREAVGGTVAQATAFQMAAWEIVYEGLGVEFGSLGSGSSITGLSVRTGQFQLDAGDAVTSLADRWLAGLENRGVSTEVFGFSNPQHQDQVSTTAHHRPIIGDAGWELALRPVADPGGPFIPLGGSSRGGSGGGGADEVDLPNPGTDLIDGWIDDRFSEPTSTPDPRSQPQSHSAVLVPLPAPGALAGLGLIGISLVRRRMWRR